MEVDSLPGHIKLLILLAEIVGVGSVGGAVAFFMRTPRPYGEIFVSWFLVAVSILFVVVVTAVWLHSYWLWRRAMRLKHDYWNALTGHDGG